MVTDNEIGHAEDCNQEGSGDCSPTTAVPGDAERYARAVQGSPSYGDLGRVTGAHSKLGVGDPGPAIIHRLSSCTDDSKDSGVDSQKIESVLSPTAVPFHPRFREVTKERFLGNAKEMKEVNSQTEKEENRDVPTPVDASSLGQAACYQIGMGDNNKIILTDRELRKGRSEVESKCSSSGNETVLPSTDEGLSGGGKKKVGRPRKGTRAPTKRSERVRLWNLRKN